MKNKKYLNDFKLASDDIHYEYKGLVYIFKGDAQQTKKMLVFLAIIMDLLIVISGVLPFEGTTGYFYIVFPFILEFCLMGLINYEIFRLTKYFDELREYRFEKTVKPLKQQFLILMIISFTSIISTSFFLLAQRFSLVGLLYLLIHVALTIISRYLHTFSNHLEFEIKKT